MLLRNHPLMSYKGIPNWPPIWTWTDGVENTRPRGEIGILKGVALSKVQPADSASCISTMKAPHILAVFSSMTLSFVVK